MNDPVEIDWSEWSITTNCAVGHHRCCNCGLPVDEEQDVLHLHYVRQTSLRGVIFAICSEGCGIQLATRGGCWFSTTNGCDLQRKSGGVVLSFHPWGTLNAPREFTPTPNHPSLAVREIYRVRERMLRVN